MKFSEEIIATLEYLCSKFGIAIDWTSDNVMPYLEDLCAKYVQYEISTSIAWIVASVSIVALLGIIWIISSVVYNKNNSFEAEVIMATSMIFFFAFLAISVLVGIVQAFDIVECYVLPEKVILEFLQRLIENLSN